jgi:hypothetical protein
VRNRWLTLAAAVAAALSGLFVALGAPMPVLAGSGSPQAGPFAVGNLLSYANSDFEGQANLIAVTNIGTISDSSVTALHGSDSLRFTSAAAGTTALKLQEGSSATQINVNTNGKTDTYTLGGWFKLPAANSGESVTFGLGLYDKNGNWLGWSSTPALGLSATLNWQYVEGQITPPSTAAWTLDSPKVTLSNAAAGQVTYMDMLVFKPYRAAQAIGAHGSVCSTCGNYTAADWIATNNTIGPLQSDKEFFNPQNTPPDGDLPSNFNQTNCYTIEQTLGMPASNWPVCILAYKGTSMTQTDMDNFLKTVPAQQELYIVWHQEPEGDTFSGEPGCGSDTGAQAFVCEFQQQANLIHNSAYYGPNIYVAMDSSGSHYGDVTDDSSPGDNTNSEGTAIGTTSCPYIVPNNANSGGGADIYLLDFYQNSQVDGTNANTETIREDNWKNWLNCATVKNRPIGFGEYGLDQSTGGTTAPCDNKPNDAANTPSAMTADDSYLEQLPMSSQADLQNHVPVVMWDYWYDDYGGGAPVCTVFDNTYGAIATWQDIETANGGG